MNNETLSRRSASRGLALAISGAAVALPVIRAAQAAPTEMAPTKFPVGIAGTPDADLIKLVDEWFAARDEAARLAKEFAPYEEAYFARQRKLEPQMPDALRVRSDDAEIGIPELRAEDGAYRNLSDIAHLRNDRWLYSKGSVTRNEANNIAVAKPCLLSDVNT